MAFIVHTEQSCDVDYCMLMIVCCVKYGGECVRNNIKICVQKLYFEDCRLELYD